MIEQPLPIPSWDELFMRHAYLISSKSKDTRTKIGAVLIKNNRVISEGYNGIPTGVCDCNEQRYQRPEKYFWFEHAERNSVYSCARAGIATKDSVMYTQGVPCADCARACIQAGITTIVVHKQWEDFEQMYYRDKWEESGKRSNAMFNECGILVRRFDGALNVLTMMDGKVIKV
jgi:dCMP deaminase